MDDLPLNPEPNAEVTELRDQVRSLRHLVKLVLVSLLIASSGLALFLYRQTTLMKRQIDSQQRALQQSQQMEQDVVLKGIRQFRAYGMRDAFYATNVLARFGLTPEAPTNAPAPTPVGPPPGALKK
jgi:hypothetical protein